jgi:N utilization substance protein B
MGNRRKGRELALQILFQLDMQDRISDEQALGLFWQNFARGAEDEAHDGEEHDGDDRDFANQLVRGVRKHLTELDAALSKASRNWRIERMARVDRNLLRLALFELIHASDVPPKVAINEAIEIAKRFGTSESPAFVNGILDRCLEDLKELKK